MFDITFFVAFVKPNVIHTSQFYRKITNNNPIHQTFPQISLNNHPSITNQSLWLLICVNLCQSVDYKTPSVVCRDGAGVSPLTRFCRDYMPYLFIGVIGLDRYRRFRYLPPADPIASLTRFSRFLSNNVPCARKAKDQLFSP